MRGNCTPVDVKCADYLLVTTITDPRPNHHHQVQSVEQCLVQSKAFPDKALDPIAFYCVTGCLDRYSQAQSRIIQLICNRQYRHKSIAGFVLAALENPLVLGCC